MTQTIRPSENSNQNAEALGSVPPQTEPLANSDPSALADEPVNYSNVTTEAVQAEVSADTAIHEATETSTPVSQISSEQPWHQTTMAKIGIGALSALSLIGVGAKLGSGGDGSEQVKPNVPAATETKQQNAQTTTSFEFHNPWSYTEIFEPVVAVSREPAEILHSIHDTTYLAAFADNDTLRDQYIKFIVGDNPDIYQQLLEHVLLIRRAYQGSGMNPDTYLEKKANIYEFLASEVVGDETLAIDYKSIDGDDSSSHLVSRMLLGLERASAVYPERYIVVG